MEAKQRMAEYEFMMVVLRLQTLKKEHDLCLKLSEQENSGCAPSSIGNFHSKEAEYTSLYEKGRLLKQKIEERKKL